jgi:hypothetical protein
VSAKTGKKYLQKTFFRHEISFFSKILLGMARAVKILEVSLPAARKRGGSHVPCK